MVSLTYKGTVGKVGQKRLGYNNGYRLGMFDKCNGRDAKALDKVPNTKYNRWYQIGYADGYESNERQL